MALENREPTAVFYDGSCALCRAARRWAERRDVYGRLVFLDLHEATPEGGRPARSESGPAEMVARLPEGGLVRGYGGWLAVASALPRWRVLARVLARPPLSLLGPPVYRLVARYRHLFSR